MIYAVNFRNRRFALSASNNASLIAIIGHKIWDLSGNLNFLGSPRVFLELYLIS